MVMTHPVSNYVTVGFCSWPLNYQSNAARHFNALRVHVAKILQNPVV